MREYDVTVNTTLVLELPVLTVTARTAFFVPFAFLPAEDQFKNRQPDERGRETWVSAKSVAGVRFELGRIEGTVAQPEGTWEGEARPLAPGGAPGALTPVTLPATCHADAGLVGKKKRHITTGAARAIVTDELSRATGAASTVQFSYGRTEGGSASVPAKYRTAARTLAEAVIPLFDVREGDYVLRVIAPDDLRSEQQDQPAGPYTTIKANQTFAYRDLYLWLRFDDQARLRAPDVAVCRLDDGAVATVLPTDLETGFTHGNAAAVTPDELALDLKPNFVRAAGVTNDQHRAATLGRSFARSPLDAIVVHATGGALIGNAINTMLASQIGPHYEIDRDGHVIKFAYDDTVCWQAGESRLYDRKARAYASAVNPLSIGIEVVNRAGIHNGDRQEPYPQRQLNGLARLLRDLRAAHPAVTRERVVGHGDVNVDGKMYVLKDNPGKFTSDKRKAEADGSGNPIVAKSSTGNYLDDRRLSCPGYQMKWRFLEQQGHGWQPTPRDLRAGDYSGFFTFDVATLPAKLRKKVEGKWYLQPGDNDAEARYAGLTWSSADVRKQLADAGVTVNFAGIVAELQSDLRALGYFVGGADTAGTLVVKDWLASDSYPEKFDPTIQALRHFYMHAFCVDRVPAAAPQAAPPPADPSDPDLGTASVAPKQWFTRTAARHLKGALDQLPAIAAAAPAAGPQHASLRPPPPSTADDALDAHDARADDADAQSA